jgi:signal transduction histidine kinase
MSLRSVFSPSRARFVLMGVLLFFATLLIAVDHVQPNDWAFFAAMSILAAYIAISFGVSLVQYKIDAVAIAQQKEELRRDKELLEQNKKTAQLLVRRDLELTRANDNLHAVDQMKTDFVSVVTHQLRTPLSAIRWTISMLLNGDFGSLTSEQRTFLMKAYESNNRMVALVKDMVFADHLETGRLTPSSDTETPLPDLLDSVLLELYPLSEHKQVKIMFQHPDSPYPHARIDSANMRAVLQNLIENALKYTLAGGSVTLTCGKDASGDLLLSVADTGIGIPEAEKSRIFTRFFRASNAQKKETDGSGLGLFIAKRVMQQCNGDIWFESGETGTTFHVRLPAVPDADKA